MRPCRSGETPTGWLGGASPADQFKGLVQVRHDDPEWSVLDTNIGAGSPVPAGTCFSVILPAGQVWSGTGVSKVQAQPLVRDDRTIRSPSRDGQGEEGTTRFRQSQIVADSPASQRGVREDGLCGGERTVAYRVRVDGSHGSNTHGCGSERCGRSPRGCPWVISRIIP